MSVIKLEPGYLLPEVTLEETSFLDIAHIENSLVPEDLLINLFDVDIDFEHPEQPLELITDVPRYLNKELPSPETQGDTLRQGFSQLTKIKFQNYALHTAAYKNDAQKILELVNEGADIHHEDRTSARPIHVAARFGALEALEVLIFLDSDLKDTALTGLTALDIALQYHQFEAARLLIETGKYNTSEVGHDGSNVLTKLMAVLQETMTSHSPEDSQKFDAALSTLEVAIPYSEQAYLTIGELGYPISLLLEVIASYATTEAQVSKIHDLVQLAKNHDHTDTGFLASMDLLHHFPTGGQYVYHLPNDKKVMLSSEGHFGELTTLLARDSLRAFAAHLKFIKADAIQAKVFDEVADIYELGAELKLNKLNSEMMEHALDLYNQGETLLLPSGWSGHFINVIINKDLGLYITANSGDRYTGEYDQNYNQTTKQDSAGLIFHKMNNPDAIDVDFIQEVLTNTDKNHLIFDLKHKYELNDRIFEIELKDQDFGNCGWQSHRNAVEGLLFYKLIANHVAPDDAQDLAKRYYEDWNQYHGNSVIDRFEHSNPGLDVDALMNILIADTIQYPNERTPHGERLVKLLSSDLYYDQFQDWVNTHYDEIKDDQVFKQFQDVYGVIATPTQPDNTTSNMYELPATMPVVETVQEHHHAPQHNVAHLMMTDPFLMGEF